MAITLQEFSELSLEERTKLFPSQKCTECRGPIEEHPDEQYAISKKPVCSDCYFDRIGNEVENSPIYHPMTRR